MKLEIVHSGDPSLVGRVIELDPEAPVVTIGRARDATLVIASDAISRRHACIERSEGAWIVRDEGSRNGIGLNGVSVQEARLSSGDQLRIGDTVFIVDRRPIVEVEYAPAMVDGLTGLANLRAVCERLEAMWRDDPRPLTLVRLDVDQLAALNDVHGHAVTDRFLAELAGRLRAEAAPEALVARVGADDFVVALPGVHLGEARRVASDLRARVGARAFVMGGANVRPGLSVGVAAEPRSVDGLLRAALDDLRAHRPPASGIEGRCEWAAGVWSPQTSRTIDVGAGCGSALFVVSEGGGGHSTGWLGARFAVRVLLERFAGSADGACLLGAADLVPDEWGWAGAAQARDAGEALYLECARELGDVAALPTDLPAIFSAIDRVLATVPRRARITGVMVGCTALRLMDERLVGAHVGMGRARVLRAGASDFEDLVVPHFLHEVAHRTPRYQPVDPATIPRDILCNGLGSLMSMGIGVDAFETRLSPGDCLLLASRELGLPDAELLTILREPGPLHVRARRIERGLAARHELTSYLDGPREVTFTLLLHR